MHFMAMTIELKTLATLIAEYNFLSDTYEWNSHFRLISLNLMQKNGINVSK